MGSLTIKIFDNLYEQLVATKKLSDNLILGFFSFFGPFFINVLNLYNEENIKKLITPSGRYIMRVEEKEKGRHHNCFVKSNHCDCPSFAFNFIEFDKQIWCKHLIAAKIALATGQFSIKAISDYEYSEVFQHTFIK
ncbi:Zinc finger SWIM domain-containing protein 7 [Dermatophagoides pteronyssinus]|uniref:Zinc finger SWIM domain-containing protein 7 n=1 Tax=Dermatophagoides pteronyssinus TaxID=6956 RepID=A0ABQ8JQC5_DERPT|nr:Zinc finger SWIM domain-containing protein 7 [Dermatophagoides pteronyssinus]